MARTDEEWVRLLSAEMDERKPRLDLYDNYFRGDHRTLFATEKFREAFGAIFEPFATNWCELVVKAVVQRLGIQGFRFGESEDADDDANAIWQANGLDLGSRMAHTEAVKSETAYLLCAPPAKGDRTGMPRITVEHPLQMIVAHDPADRSRRLAALKRYTDANGARVAVLYLPERIVTFRSTVGVAQLQALGVVLPSTIGEMEKASDVSNPLGKVPVVSLENEPDMLTGGKSDLRPAIHLNDAANKFFMDAIVTSEFQSFRQRVVTGVEMPVFPDGHPQAGQPMIQVEQAISRLMWFEEDQAKVTDLAQADLGGYVQMIDLAVQHIAAQTQTPPHYLLAKLVNLSGDALTAAETGLVSRARSKHIDFSDRWEEALRLAFGWRAIWHQGENDPDAAARDTERASAMDAETIWRDPETRAPGTISDSLLKKAQIGVPWQALMEEAGYSPTQIKRMKKQRAMDLLETEAAAFTGNPNDQGLPADPLAPSSVAAPVA